MDASRGEHFSIPPSAVLVHTSDHWRSFIGAKPGHGPPNFSSKKICTPTYLRPRSWERTKAITLSISFARLSQFHLCNGGCLAIGGSDLDWKRRRASASHLDPHASGVQETTAAGPPAGGPPAAKQHNYWNQPLINSSFPTHVLLFMSPNSWLAIW
jgi:hypothetical protein